MAYSNNISTNIVRDQSKNIDYIPTPNAKEVFDRIFLHNYAANKSFNLIGNYGTGKSTFLWALEKNLNREKEYFTSLQGFDTIPKFEFIKLVGENNSLLNTLSSELKLKGKVQSKEILKALTERREKAFRTSKGLILIIDEFGKFLEYSAKNKALDDLYLLQQISEWANDEQYQTYFIITLHQNFSTYGESLSNQDKLEWEKVKGRFVDLVFNEPVEQLLYFSSEKLKEFTRPPELDEKNIRLNKLIDRSKLVNLKTVTDGLTEAIYPLDWLSANILVHSLQRYGQNERSLFSFLNDKSNYSIKASKEDFYSIASVYDYLVNSLSSEINSTNNPHRAQWLTTFRALEKSELLFDSNFDLASEVIKTISLVNLFSKIGGLFDKDFIVNYFEITRSTNVINILERLEKAGVIRFYRHSNKINFLEGTDIDLEQELVSVTKDINTDFSISNEVLNRVDFPVLLAKKYSFLKGTNRFFEFKILDSIDDVSHPEGAIDGFINLLFDNVNLKKVKEKSMKFNDNLFVVYNNSAEIRKELLMVLKFEKLLEKHQLDKNALKLLSDEKEFYLKNLSDLVIDQLFNNDQNIWLYQGKKESIRSKDKLYNRLTEICFDIYSDTPVFNNELINKEYLSAPINTARKALFRQLLKEEEKEGLGFKKDKFPPEKAIYISLLRDSKIHQKKSNLDHFKLDEPPIDSNLHRLWRKSEDFLSSAASAKRNLNDFYEELSVKPFKLKKGFVDFWIPMYLIAKKEDYALFHKDGGFIPFISEDTIDLIHKKPQDFSIKTYDVSGLNINLLEGYKELVQLGDSSRGTKTTFLTIFGNFLRFQRDLTNYTLKTNNLSANAVRLRDAIVISKDPEDALFNQFPSALGFHSISIKKDEEILGSFTSQVQIAITEIKTAFGELLDRIENIIVDAFNCTSNAYVIYKPEICAKIEGLNTALLSQKQKIFYKRILSGLEDRNSWIKSIADVALGKEVEDMLDEEEFLLQNNIRDLSLGLLKAVEIHTFNTHSPNGKMYSIRFFGETGEFVDDKLIVGNGSNSDFKNVKEKLTQSLKSLDQQKRKELLIELLSKEISI